MLFRGVALSCCGGRFQPRSKSEGGGKRILRGAIKGGGCSDLTSIKTVSFSRLAAAATVSSRVASSCRKWRSGSSEAAEAARWAAAAARRRRDT